MGCGKVLITSSAMLLASLQWSGGANHDNESLTDASPKARQTYVAVSRNPYSFRPPPQFPQFRPPQSPRTIFLVPPPTTPAPRRRTIDFRLLMFAFLIGFLNTTPAPVTLSTTTATTTTELAVDCNLWGVWGTCSLVCDGTRRRTRTCNGVSQEFQSERCNTEPGFQSDGWYRATNCLEYLVVGTAQDHAASTAHCEGTLSARLASTGMRNYNTRLEILEKLFQSQGIVLDAWVGINNIDTETIYVWTDGFVGMPDFWNQFQPNTPAHRCHVVILGNPRSLGDLSCTSNHQAICERTIP